MVAASPTLSDREGVAAFKRWLKASGAEILATKSEYEVVRFRSGGGLSIVYRSLRGRVTFTGEAGETWSKFAAGENPEDSHPVELPPVAHQVSRRGQRAIRRLPENQGVTIADVMAEARVTARAAHRFLTDEVGAGRMARSGGRPGQPMRWYRIVREAAAGRAV